MADSAARIPARCLAMVLAQPGSGRLEPHAPGIYVFGAAALHC